MPRVVSSPFHWLLALAVPACLASLLGPPAIVAADEFPANTDTIETLSAEQAARLVAGFHGVDVLVEIKTIGTTNAERALPLNGLRTLDAETAAVLARYGPGPVLFNGLTKLSPDVAAAFAAQTQSRGLFLNGLRSLDAETAASLARFRGEWLDLNGLEKLDAATARALAEFPNRALFLNGLTKLDVETAAALAGSRTKFLHLNGLTSIDGPTAAALAKFQGVSLFLNGLTDLPLDVAQELASFRAGLLALNGLNTVDAVPLERMARFAGERLSLRGLAAVSAEVAAALVAIAKWDGRLDGIIAFAASDSVQVAATLATQAGELSLPNLRRISPRTLAVLRAKQDVVLPPDEQLDLIAEPPGANDDFVTPK